MSAKFYVVGSECSRRSNAMQLEKRTTSEQPFNAAVEPSSPLRAGAGGRLAAKHDLLLRISRPTKGGADGDATYRIVIPRARIKALKEELNALVGPEAAQLKSAETADALLFELSAGGEFVPGSLALPGQRTAAISRWQVFVALALVLATVAAPLVWLRSNRPADIRVVVVLYPAGRMHVQAEYQDASAFPGSAAGEHVIWAPGRFVLSRVSESVTIPGAASPSHVTAGSLYLVGVNHTLDEAGSFDRTLTDGQLLEQFGQWERWTCDHDRGLCARASSVSQAVQ
jgi:hypothetical protein